MRQLLQDRMVRVLLACILLLSWQPGLYAVELRGYPSSPVFTGKVGVKIASPAYLVDIRNDVTVSALHVSSSSVDNGFYVSPLSTDVYTGNLSYDGASWLPKATYAVLLGYDSAGLGFYTNTGLTPSTPYTPTLRGRIDLAGNFLLNAASPGTGLAGGRAFGVGTAPSTFPAGIVQEQVVNAAGAGTAGLKIYGELGDTHLFGNNHYIQHQVTAPTVSAATCGTTPTIAGIDEAFRLTVDGTGALTCTVTFNKVFSVAPICHANNETTANLIRTTASTSTVIVAGTTVTGDKLTVLCKGYE